VIGLDTNVLVRFLVQDDPGQARRALECIARLTEAEPGFVAREVVLELVWVLSKAYQYNRAQITSALQGLMAAVEIELEDSAMVGAVVELYASQGFDFADLMIRQVGAQRGVSTMVTFDEQAAQLDGVTLL
jgi:predicted nucleic-acid-binding protein